MSSEFGYSESALRIIDAAQVLIQKNGYNGFSYDDITRIVNLRKSSIHYHFPTKADLGAAVVNRYIKVFKNNLKEIDQSNNSAVCRLHMYTHLFRTTYGGQRRLCPCGMLGAENDSLPLIIIDEVKSFFELNLSWLSNVLGCGKKSKEMNFSRSPEEMALWLFSSLEGAMIVGRGLSSNDTVNLISDILIESIG